jgi:hypothetical protein
VAILCPEHDVLYIQVPATGSSVVAQVLREELGGRQVPEQSIRRNGKLLVSGPHCTAPELIAHDVLSREDINACLVIANVRNPFDRWTTYYQRRAGEEWIERSMGSLRRQLEKEVETHGLSHQEYEQRRRAIDKREQKQKRKGRLMRWVGFNTWMKYTLLRWRWSGARGSGPGLDEYAFPMLDGVDIAIRQERLNEGLNRVLEIAGVEMWAELPENNTTRGKKPYMEYYTWTTRALAEQMIAPQMERFGYDFEGPADDRSTIVLSEKLES